VKILCIKLPWQISDLGPNYQLANCLIAAADVAATAAAAAVDPTLQCPHGARVARRSDTW